MEAIKVAVRGAAGRMGQEVIKALCQETGVQLVGAVDMYASADSLALPDGSAVPFSPDLDKILVGCRPDVLVDFTVAQAIMPAVRVTAEHGVHMVIGTTGLSAAEL